jgi:hypothetical protein
MTDSNKATRVAAEAAARKVNRIYKVARTAFFEATDMLACIELLEASNQPDVLRSLESERADLAAGLIQKALFGRLLMTAMTAFDPVQSGDFHLKAGMDLIAEDIPRRFILQRGGDLSKIKAAERGWAECLQFEPRDRLRKYRNKFVAHLSDPPAGMKDPIVSELFALARMTAEVAEHLAHGTGTFPSLRSQVVPYQDSGGVLWEKWKPNRDTLSDT